MPNELAKRAAAAAGLKSEEPKEEAEPSRGGEGGAGSSGLSADAAAIVGELGRGFKRMRKRGHGGRNESDSEESESDPRLSSGQGRVIRIAEKQPGKLLELGLDELKKYVRARGVRDSEDGELLPAQVVRYLTSVFHHTHPPDEIGINKTRELRTLAEGLDHLLEGRIAQAGDLLMQRFTAVEMSVTQKSWEQAKHLELIPDHLCGLATRSLREAAAREESRDLRLRDLQEKHSKRKRS